jgi:ubiquinone/menaquinone biosynthesis C-methylase UbiE
MSEYQPQVDQGHYLRGSYRSKDRWLSYFYQLQLVRGYNPSSVLEIGPGEGVVTEALRRDGVVVTTCDIAPDLKPDVIGSITQLPFKDASFDVALAAEVLEHIAWSDVPQALSELARVSRKQVVISLPHPGQVLFSGVFKLPLMAWHSLRLQMPFFWKQHRFNGEHYWELGKRGYPVRIFVVLARQAGLRLLSTHKHADDPVHRLFVFEKNT